MPIQVNVEAKICQEFFTSMVKDVSLLMNLWVFWSSILWLSVSNAADRSTEKVPIFRHCWKPPSMCCVRLSSCPVEDLPGLKHACCGISFPSSIGVMRLRISHPRTLKQLHGSEIGQ